MSVIGPIIKQFRTSKSIAAKTVYQGIMSRANYFRFENGEIDTSATNLMEMLRRLNIMITEFANAYSSTDSAAATRTAQQIGQLMAAGAVTEDPAKFSAAAVLAEKSFAQTGYFGDRTTSLIASAFADYYHHGGQIAPRQPDLTIIRDFLYTTKTWYGYEVTLLFNILPLLDMDNLFPLLKRYLHRAAPLVQIEAGSTVPTTGDMLQQAFDPIIRQQDWPAYQELLRMFNAVPLQERFMYPRLMRQVYNTFANFHHDNDEDTLAGIPVIINLLKTLQMPTYLAQTEQQVAALRQWLVPVRQ
ncbi:hypothetical protein [Schleiferilactobacillus shenzhenensis]|uniref:HTH-type transcriptional regulator Rgg C-terminal domain-containing protein n=1 Tax=Schleiferilactobacillus shenzhenensis LY-73 TaxID=1231336 RepID=U4TS94_9LACO|nr:hypothetical protein [Schleiferilactobacillus shenzhenensis]ERL64347.1 hypothetical protein L248_1009 [Schleiferilactobacillus shenzhenensis LY-73]